MQEFFAHRVAEVAPDSLLSRSWETFYSLYDGLIRRYARKAGVRETDLDDVAQDVWKTVLLKLPEFERPAHRPLALSGGEKPCVGDWTEESRPTRSDG